MARGSGYHDFSILYAACAYANMVHGDVHLTFKAAGLHNEDINILHDIDEREEV